MIKVLQVVHSMTIAGTEKLVYDMIKLFPADISFVICCLDEFDVLGEELKNEGFPIYCINRKPGYDLTLPKKIAEIVKKHDIDLIHAQQYTPYFYSVLSRVLNNFKTKLIFSEHGRHYPDVTKLRRRLCNLLFNHLTHRITGVSKYTKRQLVKKEWLSKSKIEIIYNGVDIKRFEELTNKKDIQEELQISNDDIIIGYVGRLHPHKNPLMLIKAFERVQKNIPNTKLLLIGNGELYEECQNLCNNMQLQSFIKLLGIRKDIPNVMQVIDILALPSHTEATSVVLLEAMASSIPIVCTCVGGNPELVEDSKNGFLSASGDYKSMAENIIKLANNKDMRESMGKSGRQRLLKYFLIEDMVKNYEIIYRELKVL